MLGAILFGLATPSEAAAVGALGGLVLAAAYRALTWVRLKEAVFLTARTTAMVCYLFVGSWTFSSVFSYLGGHHVVENLVLHLNLSTVTFLMLTQFIIFLLGWPLEWTEIIIIFVPIFLPLLAPFPRRPDLLRGAGGAQPADLVPDPADGDVGLLPQGHRPTQRPADGHLPRASCRSCSWSSWP